MKPRTRPTRKEIESLVNQGMTARDIAEREATTLGWLTKIARDVTRENHARRLEEAYEIARLVMLEYPTDKNIQTVIKVLHEIAALFGLNAPININANIDAVSRIEVVYEDMRDELMARSADNGDDLNGYSERLFDGD